MEINVLQQLGSHPHIVSMVYSSTTGSTGGCFLALEAVQPVGFDLDRLIKQYLFAKQSVPSQLIRTLIKQLCGALGHMHDRKVLHRDLKSENVLVTKNYDAKLIDMHIACKTGFQETRWVYASKTYFPPEMCQGGQPLGHSVDTWGLGLILHQTYQHRWDLIDASRETVKLRPNRPATAEPMQENIKKAMLGLLAMKPEDRWTIAKCQSEIPPDAAASENQSYIQPAASKSVSNRKHLFGYRASASPLTAYAAVVDEKSKHLHGKKVVELGFREEHNAILLLMDNPSSDGKSRAVEKVPKKDSVIKNGSWLYFGMPGPKDGEDNTDKDIAGLTQAIFPSFSQSDHIGRSTNYKAGLMAFNLEFDCFHFPTHIGKTAVIGFQEGGAATNLRLRQNFELNLAGIVKKQDPQAPPVWFPGPEAVIEPGDLGLFVRCPLQDGTTEPTVTDEQLQPLMDPSEFAKRLGQEAPRGNV
jgi:serine/threonine protein kinase